MSDFGDLLFLHFFDTSRPDLLAVGLSSRQKKRACARCEDFLYTSASNGREAKLFVRMFEIEKGSGPSAIQQWVEPFLSIW